MLFAFDLDGTLIDNEQAVRIAYARAGVTMPERAWGSPVGAWCTPEQHQMKQRIYFECLQEHAKPGPALALWNFLMLRSYDSVAILTGASFESAQDSMISVGIPWMYLAVHGASVQDKAKWIKDQKDTVVYIDADAEHAYAVKGEADCRILIVA